MYILYMIFICIYHPSLWTFTCFGGAPYLIVYAPESHTLSNYRVRLVSGKKKKKHWIKELDDPQAAAGPSQALLTPNRPVIIEIRWKSEKTSWKFV
jgi:hypothetical protein